MRPHSQCSVFVMMRFCCVKATRSYHSIFVQKRREKDAFSCVHIDLPDNKYGAKDLRFCAFTLLRFCEAHCWILRVLQRSQKPPFLCAHIECVFEISTFDSVFEFRKPPFFVAILCRSVRTLSQKRRSFSSFLYKNGAV